MIYSKNILESVINMKIYKVYLSIPQSLKFKISYLLPSGGDLLEYSDTTNRYYCLYGWTKNSDVFEDFKLYRSDCEYYRYEIDDMSKDDFLTFKEDYKMLKISRRKLLVCEKMYTNNDDDNYVRLPLTLFEKDNIIEDVIVYDYVLESFDNSLVDYYALKDELIDALDVLNYTVLYDSIIGGDPDVFDNDQILERQETALNCMSYGVTPNGNMYSNLMENQYLIFNLVYKDLI